MNTHTRAGCDALHVYLFWNLLLEIYLCECIRVYLGDPETHGLYLLNENSVVLAWSTFLIRFMMIEYAGFSTRLRIQQND